LDTLWYYLVLPCTSSDSYSLAKAFYPDKSPTVFTLTDVHGFLLPGALCLISVSIKKESALQQCESVYILTATVSG
ncbi:hypothetical protein, partial [Pseudoflavonifractor sp. An184]|uniref:hypothetical protein n=1 Tax=Pseudoflavonifractor sp. An184 TaxID=1965576 RepID=UPI00194FEF3A